MRREFCAESFSEYGLRELRTVSETRAKVCRERQLVAQLIRSRQGGGAKDRLPGVALPASHDLNRSRGPLGRCWLKSKKMEREVHRDDG